MAKRKSIIYADDSTEPVSELLRLRLPSLFIGLGLGILISFVTSRFEQVLAHDVRVVFFLPFVTYMADAIGTQTQSIYTRDLMAGKAKFHMYLIKESALGLVLGLIFALISGFIALWWLGDDLLALSVGFSMFATAVFAPVVALGITQAFQLLREDPAAGAGPIATVVQNMISVILYGLICSVVLL